METKNCKTCNIEMIKPDGVPNHHWLARKYCSDACSSSKWGNICAGCGDRLQEGQKYFCSKCNHKECANCGTTFYCKTDFNTWKRQNYCSKRCGSYVNLRRSRERSKSRNGWKPPPIHVEEVNVANIGTDPEHLAWMEQGRMIEARKARRV